MLGDLAGAVAAVRARDRDAVRARARPSTGRTSVKPRSRRTPSSGGWQSSGTSLGSRSTAVSSRWSACRWVTSTRVEAAARAPRRARAARTSGLRRSLGVSATAGRAPGGVEHRVHQHAAPRQLDQQGRVPDQPQPHRLRILHQTCTRPAHGPHSALAHSAPWRAPLICVVEDEAVIAAAVAARLRAEGFDGRGRPRRRRRRARCASACGPTSWSST